MSTSGAKGVVSQLVRAAPQGARFVYNPEFNVRFFGIEKLHPFDSCKYAKIADTLAKEFGVDFVEVHDVSEEVLLRIHSQAYLRSLRSSRTVARVTELFPLAFVPNFLLQRKVLTPMRYQVSGTVVAVHTALTHGWSVCLGGGMHHAWRDDGGGWCVYDDIALAFDVAREDHGISSALVVDLDAHQGNGVERDRMLHDLPLRILDMYNSQAYPQDEEAKRGIDVALPLPPGCSDDAYLSRLRASLPGELDGHRPNLVIYNAGSDILRTDPLGHLGVSPSAMQERDLFVVSECLGRGIPVAMVLSGGYAPESARMVADSLANLYRTCLSKHL